jgi:amidohydrolase
MATVWRRPAWTEVAGVWSDTEGSEPPLPAVAQSYSTGEKSSENRAVRCRKATPETAADQVPEWESFGSAPYSVPLIAVSGTWPAAGRLDDLRDIRRTLHGIPETGLHLPKTQRVVLDALGDLPIELHTGQHLSSVVGVLRGGGGTAGDRPSVLLRADMDALALAEDTGLPYASTEPGVMHACGHDLHTAMLIGAARLLSERSKQLPGDVVFMFQPGEEGDAGARHMIGEGVLDATGGRVRAALALHAFAGLASFGTVLTRPGTIMAASDALAVTVRGRGGHASMPHTARDPITAAAAMVVGLQTAVTRRVDALDPVVCTVGVLRAGTRRNIIPESAYFEATVRTFSRRQRETVRQLLPEVINGIAAAHGVTAEVTVEPYYPATVNDAAEVALVRKVTGELPGLAYTEMPAPLTTAEDFSYVLEQVPGAMVLLGAGPRGTDVGRQAPNHSASVLFDDDILAGGARLYAAWAMQRLRDAVPSAHRSPSPEGAGHAHLV